MKQQTFTLTKDHLKLLKNVWVNWENSEFGAPAIDCKRPYGNSYVQGDIAEILGWKRGEELTEQQEEKAYTLHLETQTALQIILTTQKFKVGKYEKTDEYDDTSWKLINNK